MVFKDKSQPIPLFRKICLFINPVKSFLGGIFKISQHDIIRTANEQNYEFGILIGKEDTRSETRKNIPCKRRCRLSRIRR